MIPYIPRPSSDMIFIVQHLQIFVFLLCNQLHVQSLYGIIININTYVAFLALICAGLGIFYWIKANTMLMMPWFLKLPRHNRFLSYMRSDNKYLWRISDMDLTKAHHFCPIESQIAKFMGPTWGPPGACRPQMGPMLAPWTLLSAMIIV